MPLRDLIPNLLQARSRDSIRVYLVQVYVARSAQRARPHLYYLSRAQNGYFSAFPGGPA